MNTKYVHLDSSTMSWSQRGTLTINYLPLDKMAAISQTTF